MNLMDCRNNSAFLLCTKVHVPVNRWNNNNNNKKKKKKKKKEEEEEEEKKKEKKKKKEEEKEKEKKLYAVENQLTASPEVW